MSDQTTHSEILRQLFATYGWNEVESKNTVMISFKHDDCRGRINLYYTTGTITIQGTRLDRNMYHASLDDVERLLIKLSME